MHGRVQREGPDPSPPPLGKSQVAKVRIPIETLGQIASIKRSVVTAVKYVDD